MTLKLGMQHRVLEYYQVYSNDDPVLTLTYFTARWLTLTYFTARSNLVPYAFVWEKGKTVDFSETIVVCDLKLATDNRSNKEFLLTSKLCPLRAVCPLPRGPGAICMYMYFMTKCIKSDFKEISLKQIGKVIRPFCWYQKFAPWGCLPLPQDYIHVLNHYKKNCIKSDFKDICLKLATNEWSDKTFLLTSKLCSLGAVCPCPGAMYMYKIMKKCIKSDFKEIVLKLATNDRSDEMFLLTLKFRPQGDVRPCRGVIYMYKIMKKNV